MAHGFEPFQKALRRLSPFQAAAIAQSIAHGHMTAFDGFGRLATGSMEPCSDVLSTGARSRHRLHIRLVVIGHHRVRDNPATLDGLAKERLGTGRVAVLTQQDVNDDAILVDGAVQVALLGPAEQEHLVHEPAPADPTTMTSY